MIPPERKKEIADKLTERVKTIQCPMCRTQKFTMLDDYFTKTFQPDFGTLSVGGPTVPTIALVCNNCGFVSEHALGALGLLTPEQTKPNPDGSSK